MKTYNGHRSWNAWNVSLWISNDESSYRFALECIERAKKWLASAEYSQVESIPHIAGLAARYFIDEYAVEKTPDGAKYNHLSVRLCLESFME